MLNTKTPSIYSRIKYTPKEDLKPGDVFYLSGKNYPEYVEDLTTLKEDFGVFVGTSGHYGCDGLANADEVEVVGSGLGVLAQEWVKYRLDNGYRRVWLNVPPVDIAEQLDDARKQYSEVEAIMDKADVLKKHVKGKLSAFAQQADLLKPHYPAGSLRHHRPIRHFHYLNSVAVGEMLVMNSTPSHEDGLDSARNISIMITKKRKRSVEFVTLTGVKGLCGEIKHTQKAEKHGVLKVTLDKANMFCRSMYTTGIVNRRAIQEYISILLDEERRAQSLLDAYWSTFLDGAMRDLAADFIQYCEEQEVDNPWKYREGSSFRLAPEFVDDEEVVLHILHGACEMATDIFDWASRMRRGAEYTLERLRIYHPSLKEGA